MADAITPTTSPANTPEKDWLAFATYFFPLVLIYTMIKKGNEANYLWHSKNAAGAIVINIIIQVLVQILWSLITIPLLYTLLNLASLALFVLMVYGGWQAANGKLPTLPVVTQIGQKVPLEKWFKVSNSTSTPATSTTTTASVSVVTPATAPAPAPAPTPTPAPVVVVAPTTPSPAPVTTPTEPTPPSQPQA